MITKEDTKRIETYLSNKARDIELAQYNVQFLDDEKIMVSYALSMYQNTDGGFAHGLDIDLFSPISTTIETILALKILKKSGFDKTNLDEFTKSMISKAFRFLFNKATRINDLWTSVEKECNDYPHAPWREYSENERDSYYPTVFVLSYALHFFPKTSRYFKEALRIIPNAVNSYLDNEINDYQLVNAFTYLAEALIENNMNFKNNELIEKINNDALRIINHDDSVWGNADEITPLDIFDNYQLVNEEMKDLVNKNLSYLENSRNHLGIWINKTNWNSKYETEEEIASIKADGYKTLENIILLKSFSYL